MRDVDRDEHAFVVRVWRDSARPDDWRGMVEEIATSERRYFRDFVDLCTFIVERRTGRRQRP